MITANLMVHTVSLLFAGANLMLLLGIISTISTVAESPRAWTALTMGLAMIIMQFSLDVFRWANSMFDVYLVHVISAIFSTFGFIFLFYGVYEVWRTIRE